MTREDAIEQLDRLRSELTTLQFEAQRVEREIASLQREYGVGTLVLTSCMIVQPDGWGYPGTADKLGTIKCIRELLGLGLREAKTLVESLPQPLPGVRPDHPIIVSMRANGATFA